MYNPVSTYRLQFNKDFTFKNFDKVLPYLEKLGVTTIYASPVFRSTPGSTHGYDGLNPHEVDPEIGTEKQLREFGQTLSEKGMGWLQDIVPNHMAFDPKNPWLMDVLEKGPQSLYASFFDVALTSQIYHGPIMVPFLGAPVAEVIKNGELKIAYQQGRLVFKYFESVWPLKSRSYTVLLAGSAGKKNEAVEQLLKQMQLIKEVEEPTAFSNAWDEFILQFSSLMKHPTVREYVRNCIKEANKNQELLIEILEDQHYRLSYWQDTDHTINFRRFFTVNGLICLNIQNKDVFRHYHEFIKSLLSAGVFQGLRVDHIDGLFDPKDYLEQLRELSGDETYIVVEKILNQTEGIPNDWAIQGNTGYDFLAIVNNVFTKTSSRPGFTKFYQKLVRSNTPISQQVYEKKSQILYEHMAGELDNLYQLFRELNVMEEKAWASIHAEDMKQAIGEFLIRCPVYRYYGNSLPLHHEEESAIRNILNIIRRNNDELYAAVNQLEHVLLVKPHHYNHSYNRRALRFYQRCMQFTGPLMAKGVEDTMMYTYHRFIGHNEVGDSPEAFGISTDSFHDIMKDRQEKWPLSINGTSTHDTKRGEDVRARLNVLSDLPEEWLEQVQKWQKLNEPLKENGAPDANDEYFIYQTIVGAYPMPGEDEDDFNLRIQEYLQKALREAKTHSNWTTPNEEYENACKAFAVALLNKTKPFWKSFTAFHKKIADHGIINSLSQVMLKFTCPGVPDVYQGCELWDLSLVDPDNRRPVNYEQRTQWLEEFDEVKNEDLDIFLQDLWQNRYNGKLKLWLVNYLLKERKSKRELFIQGQYIPLNIEGEYKENVLAFGRKHKQNWYIVAVPLHTAELSKEQAKAVTDIDWKDTRISVPGEVIGEWEHIILKYNGTQEGGIYVRDIFKTLPLAILKTKQADNARGAGILLHISSLASPFGIGDMGHEAKSFADFLHRSNQKYWQLLPLNPTEAGQAHSPYSSISSRAGNPLLISPELLVADGLLEWEDLHHNLLPNETQTDYTEAERVKKELFELAFHNYRQRKPGNMKHRFEEFCEKESKWLDDFALFMVLKKENEGKAWFQWPEEYKLRDAEALKRLENFHAYEVDKIKWLQFIFSKQWSELKTYCNDKDIRLFGDLPFYISYDSVDVWSDKEIFCIDEEGIMTGVAGVPPDSFSEDGQLWGMPVFKWDVLKKRNYDWWVGRFQKNAELFDIVRLDHFRAFADYWEVPAGETTAKHGRWVQGPGADFFKKINEALGELPFIAEDLGEINAAVYQLRDEFKFPGMNILQFAFGPDMPQSIYIPHNYITNSVAYTGTHDNNTVRGWYRHEANDLVRHQVNEYTGMQVNEHNIHEALGRLAYSSIAKTAILPMQDVLGLDETARMNIPASTGTNWGWRLLPGQISYAAEHMLKEWTWLYNRE